MPVDPVISRSHGPLECAGPVTVVLTRFRPDRVFAAEPSGESRSRLSVFADRLGLAALRRLRNFLDTHRDHFANPVSVERQLERARHLAASLGPERCRLLVDAELLAGTHAEGTVPVDDDLVAFDLDSTPSAIGAAKTLIWVWPDPLGLASRRTEREHMQAAREVWVLNGRGRLFRLDTRMRHRLRWRRILAASRAPELLAGVLIWPVGLLLALHDYLFGSRQSDNA
jgi:hypothetical protein